MEAFCFRFFCFVLCHRMWKKANAYTITSFHGSKIERKRDVEREQERKIEIERKRENNSNQYHQSPKQVCYGKYMLRLALVLLNISTASRIYSNGIRLGRPIEYVSYDSLWLSAFATMKNDCNKTLQLSSKSRAQRVYRIEANTIQITSAHIRNIPNTPPTWWTGAFNCVVWNIHINIYIDISNKIRAHTFDVQLCNHEPITPFRLAMCRRNVNRDCFENNFPLHRSCPSSTP